MAILSSVRFARAAGAALAAALAAGMFVGPAAAASPSMLFVSREHGSDANACTASAPCLTIGHALSVAPAGATVKVDEGTYAEQVSITKTVHLMGAGAVIDATGQAGGIEPLAGMGIVGYGLLVFGPGAAGTSVQGLTVQGALGEGILVAGTTRVTLMQNLVQHNDLGAPTGATFECQAQGPIPGDCGEGLHLVSTTWSRVLSNVVQHNVGGILVTDEMGPSAHNTIAWNVSRDNAEDCGITLPSHNPMAMTDPTKGGVYDNLVAHNLSIGNGGAGVGMFASAPGTAAYDNTIVHNTLRNNGEAGIAIHAHAPNQNVSGNVISHNLVSGNGIDPDSGSGHPTGIALFSAVVPATDTVTDNTIQDEYWGIFVAGSFNVDLADNHFTGTVTVASN